MAQPRDNGRTRVPPPYYPTPTNPPVVPAQLPQPSRRHLLAGATAALVAGAAIAAAHGAEPPVLAPSPDANLHALVAEFWRHDAGLDAWNAGRIPEAEGEMHNAAWWACCRALTGVTPRTEVGKTAKAAVAFTAMVKVADCSSDVEALGRATLAELAGRIQPALSEDADGELVVTCNRFAATRKAWVDLIESRHGTADEVRTQPENDRLSAECDGLLDEIEALPEATTLAGAAALARAALALAPLGMNGRWEAGDDYAWLALMAAETLAGRLPA